MHWKPTTAKVAVSLGAGFLAGYLITLGTIECRNIITRVPDCIWQEYLFNTFIQAVPTAILIYLIYSAFQKNR